MGKDMQWETILCRCGAMRGRGDSCGDCGFIPRPDDANEVNHHIVKRRRVVSLIDELVPQHLAQPSDPPTFSEIVETFPDAFGTALGDIDNEETVERAAALMTVQLTRLERARRSLQPFNALRPFAMERAQLEVLNQLSTWWPIYREAITSVDIAFAQKKAEEGQRVIDSSANAITQIGPILEALKILEDYQGEPSLTRRQILALQTKYPGIPISDLETLGERTLTQDLGITSPDGMGLQYLMIKMLAESVFLPDAFTRKIRELTTLWKDNEQRVREIAAMTHSVEDLADVAAHLTETFLQFDHAVKNANHLRGVVRAATKLMSHVYEDAQPLWTWNVLLRGTSTAVDKYSKTAQMDSTAHIKKLARALPQLCEDTDVFYRNATHHGGSVRPDEDGEHVVLSTRSGGERRLPTNEFIDRLYALTESVLAMYWIAHLFLAVYKIEPPSRNDMPSGFGMSLRDEAFLLIEARLGRAVLQNEVINDVWEIKADLPAEDVLEVAVALATTSGSEVKFLELRNTTHSGALAEISPDYVQSLLSEDQTENSNSDSQSVMNLLTHKAAITLNGRSLLTDDELRWGVAALGFQLLYKKDPIEEQNPRLRTLKTWAERRQLKDVTSDITAIMRTWRNDDQGKQMKEIRRLAALMETLPAPDLLHPSGVRIQAAHVKDSRTTPLVNVPTIHTYDLTSLKLQA
jgi:hypothetical protein